MSSPLSHRKRKYLGTPVSESKNLIIRDDDEKESSPIIEAAKDMNYMSPLGKRLIKESLESDEPLDLLAINKAVAEHDQSEEKEEKDFVLENVELEEDKQEEDDKKMPALDDIDQEEFPVFSDDESNRCGNQSTTEEEGYHADSPDAKKKKAKNDGFGDGSRLVSWTNNCSKK